MSLFSLTGTRLLSIRQKVNQIERGRRAAGLVTAPDHSTRPHLLHVKRLSVLTARLLQTTQRNTSSSAERNLSLEILLRLSLPSFPFLSSHMLTSTSTLPWHPAPLIAINVSHCRSAVVVVGVFYPGWGMNTGKPQNLSTHANSCFTASRHLAWACTGVCGGVAWGWHSDRASHFWENLGGKDPFELETALT